MKSGRPIALPGQRIGLLGGSFDPPHCGHMLVTRTALIRFGLDAVWWLVTPGNPLKARGPAPLEQRVAAARSIARHPRVVVTDIEAELGTRMTADTIVALQKIYVGVRFVWLMGSDNLATFDHWDRWRTIAARVPIGVIARPGSRLTARTSRAVQQLGASARLPEHMARLLPYAKPPAWVLVNTNMSDISSSEIRRKSRPGSGTDN